MASLSIVTSTDVAIASEHRARATPATPPTDGGGLRVQHVATASDARWLHDAIMAERFRGFSGLNATYVTALRNAFVDEHTRRAEQAHTVYGYATSGAQRRLVGVCAFDVADAQLLHVYVHTQHRRRGIGRALIEMAKDELTKGTLASKAMNVWAENEPAIMAFYAACGFTIDTDAQADADDTVRMQCDV